MKKIIYAIRNALIGFILQLILINLLQAAPPKAQGTLDMEDVIINGTVTDQNGAPIPGVTVLVKGTTKGTTTDLDGFYTIIVSENSTLVYSFIGYVTQEVSLGNKDLIDITLSEDVSALEEVVVVGYGEQKKINLTGAVSQIGSEALENRPAPNLTRMLQGALPNLNIRMVDGSPTRSSSFNIRGNSIVPHTVTDGD